MKPRPSVRGAPCGTSRARIRHRRPQRVSPAFSTCPPGASLFLAPPTTLLATDAPVQRRHGLPQTPIGRVVSTRPRTRRRRRRCILLFYLPNSLRDGGDACAPFPCSFFRRPDDDARENPGQERRSPRSYLRCENAVPTIFLLFRCRCRRLHCVLLLLGGQREGLASPLRPRGSLPASLEPQECVRGSSITRGGQRRISAGSIASVPIFLPVTQSRCNCNLFLPAKSEKSKFSSSLRLFIRLVNKSDSSVKWKQK